MAGPGKLAAVVDETAVPARRRLTVEGKPVEVPVDALGSPLVLFERGTETRGPGSGGAKSPTPLSENLTGSCPLPGGPTGRPSESIVFWKWLSSYSIM